MLKKIAPLLTTLLISISTLFAQKNDSTFIGGFSDLHYNDVIYEEGNAHTPGTLSLNRFNIFSGYNFDNRFSFYSEVSLQQSQFSEIALHQAYLDWKLRPKFGIRGGLLLVPFGLTNLNRSPTNFHGVRQPNMEINLIPTTWREIGMGIYGKTPFDLDYKVYALAGLKPSGITGAYGIRDARQNGFNSSTANLALASRLGYRLYPNLKLGASYYVSTISNRIVGVSGQKIDSMDWWTIFHMLETHIQYEIDRFETKGLIAFSRTLDVENLNREFGNAAGQIQAGGYIELAYNILPFLGAVQQEELFVFARGESYDTNFTTGEIPRNDEYLREELTVGLTYKPIPNVALKADYQFLTSLGTKFIEQLNIGFGYHF